MIRLVQGGFALALSWFLAGCEATQPKQVDNPDPLGLGAAEEQPAFEDTGESTGVASETDSPKSVDGEPLGADPDPVFTERMSVNEAINAVPSSIERLNIEQEVLAEPLQQADVYEPCKLGNGHFKARVAVWQGRAVGVDVETRPSNPNLAKCIDQQIRQIKWSEKVRSLNTVEYSY
jgi:hypothetical protein